MSAAPSPAVVSPPVWSSKAPRAKFQYLQFPRSIAAGLFREDNEVGGHEVTPTEFTILCHMVVATLGCYRELVPLHNAHLARIAAVGEDHIEWCKKNLVEERQLLIRQNTEHGVLYGLIDWLRAEVLDAGREVVCGNCNAKGAANSYFMAPRALLVDYLAAAKPATYQVTLAVYEHSMRWDTAVKAGVGEWVEIKIASLQAATGFSSHESIKEALADAVRDGVIEIQHRSGRHSSYRARPEGLVGGDPRFPREVDRTKKRSPQAEEEEKESAKDKAVRKQVNKPTPPIESRHVQFQRCLNCQHYAAAQMVLEGFEPKAAPAPGKSHKKPPPSPPKPIISVQIPAAEQPIYEELCRYRDLLRAVPDAKSTHEFWLALGGELATTVVAGTSSPLREFSERCQLPRNLARFRNERGWKLPLMIANDSWLYCEDLRKRSASAAQRKTSQPDYGREIFLRQLTMDHKLPDDELKLIVVVYPELAGEVDAHRARRAAKV